MYSLSIAIGMMSWRMLYQDEEKAKAAYIALKDTTVPTIEITDDYGQTGTFKPMACPALMLEDMDKSKLAHIEQGLHRARTQANAQSRAQSDPVLAQRLLSSDPEVLPEGGAPPRPPGEPPKPPTPPEPEANSAMVVVAEVSTRLGFTKAEAEDDAGFSEAPTEGGSAIVSA